MIDDFNDYNIGDSDCGGKTSWLKSIVTPTCSTNTAVGNKYSPINLWETMKNERYPGSKGDNRDGN